MAKDENKQKSVFLSRKITLERAGKEPVVMQRGHNIVDADVADHPFVKAHGVEASDDPSAGDAALHAKIAELVAANKAGAAQLREALNKVDELQKMVDAFTLADKKK